MFSTQYIQHVSFPSSKLQIIAVAMDVPQVWVVHSWLRWDLLCNEATIEQFEQIIACEFQCLQLGLEERPSAMGLFTINAAAFSKSIICLKHMPPISSVYYYGRTYVRTYVRKYGWTDACMHAWHVCTYVRMYVKILCVGIYIYVCEWVCVCSVCVCHCVYVYVSVCICM